MCPHCGNQSSQRVQDYPTFEVRFCNRCQKMFVKFK